MIAFLRTLLERDNYDIGLAIVRAISLLFALAALFIGIVFATGSGLYWYLAGAALFLLSALYPRQFGKVAGGAILCVAFVVMISGPNGEAGLTSYSFWRAVPLYLLGGMFMRPAIVTLAYELMRPQR